MKLFTSLYNMVLTWSKHQHAPKYLSAVSFSEASFFPVPVAIMLIPMSFAQPSRAWKLAGLTLVFSVLGGVVGYFIGWGAYEVIAPLVHHYAEQFANARNWFSHYGVWIVLMAGFSPVPYKIFTITAGALSMPFIPFVIASIIGRASQFYLIAFLVTKFGSAMEPKIHQYIEWLGWGSVIVISGLLLILNLK
ncbi:MAG: DedA family protein [gamma proteobacterium symbiont of Bathyaustriella thionipta]|nr:DedA family protein [gamma proteobacterium symbiont of Bathyaustriella thionipta]MCU7954078.1 DedA family protein [gamma proteobacterium symbiont of Bathyaustriella thionipta]MCU7956436.1 DedA family protein [gamma proteobacterium symbiont of Bathyaustriella thionipta]MCU7967706.1 DedA family protein [gamma proteobacterium symbiont of Bathyaustriella thionipta]